MNCNFKIEKVSDKVIRVRFNSPSEFDQPLLVVEFHKFLKSEGFEYIDVLDCVVHKGGYTLGYIDLQVKLNEN